MIAEAQVLPILKKLKDFPIDRRILQFYREEQYFLVIYYFKMLNCLLKLNVCFKIGCHFFA